MQLRRKAAGMENTFWRQLMINFSNIFNVVVVDLSFATPLIMARHAMLGCVWVRVE